MWKVGVAALLLVTAPLWAVASAPVGRTPKAGPDLPSMTAVAAIRARRPSGYPVGGIDISNHDHRFGVHWPTEVAAGSQFVYVKATEGITYVNPHFDSDYDAARAAGRFVGAYVYARPDLGDPVGQADHFLRYARFTRDSSTLVPFVDLEWPYSGVHSGACYNLTPAQMRAWIGAFIGRIAAAVGRKPMIYTNTYWWNPCTGHDPSYATYPLDIANYTTRVPVLPAGWTSFTLWQYQPGDPDQRYSHDRDIANLGPAGVRSLTWPPQA